MIIFIYLDLQGNILIAGAHRGKVWLDRIIYNHRTELVKGSSLKFQIQMENYFVQINKNENDNLQMSSPSSVTWIWKEIIYLSTLVHLMVT